MKAIKVKVGDEFIKPKKRLPENYYMMVDSCEGYSVGDTIETEVYGEALKYQATADDVPLFEIVSVLWREKQLRLRPKIRREGNGIHY